MSEDAILKAYIDLGDLINGIKGFRALIPLGQEDDDLFALPIVMFLEKIEQDLSCFRDNLLINE
ncbi:hypothetical protein P7M19_01070 [Bisgaard Taxon 10/6]|uniref:hypothetical protein n=1 Tax=Exercitatus varius TaxID=67857 RepID=UPI00294B6508|nr:hypothetical protein [Exercitatus varius]MDG2938812.1 hypothetical protein [Exercitatus varius]